MAKARAKHEYLYGLRGDHECVLGRVESTSPLSYVEKMTLGQARRARQLMGGKPGEVVIYRLIEFERIGRRQAMNDGTRKTTCVTPLCINCGFVGASYWINGQGPYCGKCAAQAVMPPAQEGESNINRVTIG